MSYEIWGQSQYDGDDRHQKSKYFVQKLLHGPKLLFGVSWVRIGKNLLDSFQLLDNMTLWNIDPYIYHINRGGNQQRWSQ